MLQRRLSCLFYPLLFLSFMMGGLSNADALTEAGNQFQQQRYAEVETTLAPLLASEQPPVEALALSYRAARAEGRVITAERRVRALIEREGGDSPLWIYEGALVARDVGDEARMLDRLMFFARKQTDKTPELHHALDTLVRRGNQPEAFQRYHEVYGAGEARFELGMGMLRRLRSENNTGGLVEMSGILVRLFQGEEQIDEVVLEMNEVLNARTFGIERNQVYQALFSGNLPGLDAVAEIISRHNIASSEMILLQKAYGKPLPTSWLQRFGNLDHEKNEIIGAQMGRAYLGFEPLYRTQGTLSQYRAYLWQVYTQPSLFIGGEKRLITEEQAGSWFKFAAEQDGGRAQESMRAMGRLLLDEHRDVDQRFVEKPELRTTLLRNLPNAFRTDQLKELIRGKERDPAALQALVQLTGGRLDVRLDLLDAMNGAGLGDVISATAREEMMVNPTTFSTQNLARNFLNASAVTGTAKAAVIRAVHNETGNASRLRELLTHRDINNTTKSDADIQAVLAELNKDRLAKDPVTQVLIDLAALPNLRQGRDPEPRAVALVEQAFTAYGKPYPDPGASPVRKSHMEEILVLFRRACDNSTLGRRTYARVLSPRLSAAADWESLVDFSITDNSRDGLSAHILAKHALGAGVPFRSEFFAAAHPQEDAPPLFEAFYDQGTPDNVMWYLARHRGLWTPEVLATQLGKALAARPLTSAHSKPWSEVVGTLTEKAAAGNALPLEEIGRQLLFPTAEGDYVFWALRRDVLRLFNAADRGPEGFRIAAEGASDHPWELLSSLFWDRDYAPFEGVTNAPKPGYLKHNLLVEFLPKFRALTPERRVEGYQSDNLYRHLNWILRARDLPEAERAQYEDLYSMLMRARARGARGDNNWGEISPGVRLALKKAVDDRDYPAIIDLVVFSGIAGSSLRESETREMITLLQEADMMEPLLLLTQVHKEGEPGARVALNQARSFASSQVPGIYPVERNDPAYPLFLAADELSQNNPERAWALLREHLEVFEKDPLVFPPDFSGWALERLREVRGDNDALLEKSLELSSNALTRSGELTPGLTARLMLNRAEIYRHQKNFEAARLEYQSIRTHPDLARTVFGRQAMYRDVDLMIAMGNTAAAEGLLEYWLSNPDTDLRAKAYYFQALIAFNAGDDDATSEYLDKVFELDFTQSEARLLHGKWRLRTNYEVDNPEVLLGTLLDRTLLRPGQPLRISVQDQNLSIVGGGTAIPVIVRSSNGKDEERINLFPGARDPKLFRGGIDTALAAATVGNRVLEVNGMDEVIYEIDPVFLRERGMEGGEPKRLRIVDDARLAVSAGAILSEAEQQAREITLQMSGESERFASGGSNVRPGNPVYVRVRDRDRSAGSADGRVWVTAETSSGDRLARFELKEIAAYSGEFSGEIPTALPPPRVETSDSAEGSNPGDVINRKRNGMWRSRSDGQPGKWILADTMNSHLVKRAELVTEDAEKIAEIRLWGMLAGTETLLGTFPRREVAGGGVQLRTTGQNLRSLVEYREYFTRSTDNKEFLQDFRYEVKDNSRRIHLRGAFWLPEDRDLRLHFIPLKPGDSNRMKDAWLTLLVNGETVVSGRGSDLIRQSSLMPLARGAHVIEVFGYVRQDRDGFVLGVEQAGGEVVPIPADWFSLDKNPELAEHLRDWALLSRTDNVWVAGFEEPLRLRSIRWEFMRYSGDALSVSEIRIEDANGQRVLPAETDFSEALGNDTLEIAPGDRITVTYVDEVTSDGQRKQLSQELRSQFTNGEIGFYFEQLRAGERGMIRSLYGAYRFRPGDDVLIMVADGDLDLSPAADEVEVTVVTRSGEKVTLRAVEQASEKAAADAPVHTGRFVALLRTREGEPSGGDLLNVRKGDRLSVSYMDRENTTPGIPVPRSAELEGVQPAEAEVTLFHTWRESVVDSSEEAERRREQIRQRGGNLNVGPIHLWMHYAMPMTEEEIAQETLFISPDSPLPIEIFLPSEAMHAGSYLTLRAVADSAPDSPLELRLPLGRARGDFQMRANPAIAAESSVAPAESSLRNAEFGGQVRFRLGRDDLSAEMDETLTALPVQGNDRVRIEVLTPEGQPLFARNLQLVSEGSIALKDSTYAAERSQIHLGERFFIEVSDTDRDLTSEPDTVMVLARGSLSGNTLEVELRETLPHSGIFSGILMPRFADAAGEQEGGGELAGIPTLPVSFGEKILFEYSDEVSTPHRSAGTRSVRGSIFEGSDGSLMAFTKYFPDPDMAVRVQFRLAESLFEMAKDYRKLKQEDRSSEAIGEGRRILEEALASHPETALAVEGEYLLANLYQELGAENEKDAPEIAQAHYGEALARFSQLLSSWPDSDFAARAQYHKALCLEKLGDFAQAAEEYVKMTYIYPESPLVGEAAIRLATHYYRVEERFDTAGKIYANFYRRFPTHPLASRALFMSAQCHLKQGEVWEEERRTQGIPQTQLRTERILDEYRSAVKSLQGLIDDNTGTVDKEMRAQAMYWAGDASLRAADYPGAYIFLKRTVLEYPESEWARRSRGMLLQSAEQFEGLE